MIQRLYSRLEISSKPTESEVTETLSVTNSLGIKITYTDSGVTETVTDIFGQVDSLEQR